MKVVFVLPVFYETGSKEPKMSPFIMPQVNSITPHLESYKIVYLEMGFGFRSLRNKIGQLRELKKNTSADDMVVFSLYGSLHGFLIRIILGPKFKIVNTFGGSDIFGSKNSGLFWGIKNKLTRVLSFWTAKRTDHIIVKSQEIMNELKIKVDRPLSVVPNGVDLNTFKVLENREQIRSSLGWSKEEFVILFNLRRNGSKLESVKNFPLAQEVKKRLDLIEEANVRFEIISNKSHEEIIKILNAGDCLLLTSLHEGSPNIIKEAMACNLPVVSVNCGDVLERLSLVENSYVSNTYNSEEIAEYCIQVIHRKSRSNGRQKIIEQGLSSEDISQKILLILSSVYSN